MTQPVRRFAPPFIEEMAAAGRMSGSFDGSVLVVDLPGFTSLTETYIRQGLEGAERLSLMLDAVVDSASREISAGGGFACGFAGDAILGVFPGGCAEDACSAAEGIHEALREPSRDIGMRDGSMAKAGVAEGGIEWLVASCESRLFHCFSGEALLLAADAQESCRPGAVNIAGESFASHGRRPSFRGFASGALAKDLPFIPDRVLTLDSAGEFRSVVSIFLSADSEERQGLLPGFVSNILRAAEDFGGFLSGAEIKAAGSALLVVFGAPVSHEDDVERADQFLRTVFAGASGRLRAGVEVGTAFAGHIGSSDYSTYTVIGTSVNTASRLMYRSIWGRILSGAAFSSRTGLRRVKSYSARLRGHESERSISVLSPYGTAAPVETRGGPLFGREDVLASLRDAAAGAGASQEPAVVHITGEAGSGKTRIVKEFMASCPGLSFHFLQTDGVLRKSLNPFRSLLKSVFSLSGASGDEGARVSLQDGLESLAAELLEVGGSEALADSLSRSGPPLASVVGVDWPGSVFETLDPRGRFESISGAVTALLQALSFTGRRVFVLDDAQWLDGDSRRLLARLVGAFPGSRAAWLIAARPEDETGSPVILPGDPSLSLRIELLGKESTGEMIEHELGRRPSPALVDLLHAQTGGNPFYIEQYCGILKGEGVLVDGPDGVEPARTGLGVPDTLSALIASSLDRLDPPLRKAIQAAAVLGRDFEVPVLAGMLDGYQVEEALRRGMEERFWSDPQDGRCSFRNALLRDAVYSMQLTSRLRELHSTAAGSLRSIHAGDPAFFADLAYHYEKAGQTGEAAEFLELAAGHAARSFLNVEALDLYGRLIRLLGTGWRRSFARIELGTVMSDLGRWEDAAREFGAALDEAGSCGCHRLCAKAAVRLARLRFDKGDEAAGEELLEKASSFLDIEEDHVLRSQICTVKSVQLLVGDDIQGALRLCRVGLEHAMLGGDAEQILRARGSLGNAFLQSGDRDSALEIYTEVHEGAIQAGNLQLEALTTGNMALIYRDRGELEKAESLTRDQLRIAGECGNRMLACMAMGNLGNHLARRWEPEEALRCYRRAVEMAREMGSVVHEAIARANLALHCRYAGLLDEALANAVPALEICRESGLDHYLGAFLLTVGEIYADMDRPEEAMACLAEALPLAQEPIYLTEARVLEGDILSRSDRQRALEVLREVVDGSDAAYAAEAACLVWRMLGDEQSKAVAVALNRKLLGSGDYPWRAAGRLESMGELVDRQSEAARGMPGTSGASAG